METGLWIQGAYYVRASSSLADSRPRVLKQGDLFGIFDQRGDIRPLGFEVQGLFFQDTRFLSRVHLTLNGQSPLLLSSSVRGQNDLLVINLTNPDPPEDQKDTGISLARGSVHLERRIFLHDGSYRERMRLSNFGVETLEFVIALELDADFTDMFEVRGMSRARRGSMLEPKVLSDGVVLGYAGLDGRTRHTILRFQPRPRVISPSRMEFAFRLAPHGGEDVEVRAECAIDHPSGIEGNGGSPPAEVRIEESGVGLGYEQALARHEEDLNLDRADACTITSSNEQFNAWIERSNADLRMLVTRKETGPYPYAGIPWFSTSFGRDGIITGLQVLLTRPDIARGVLAHLAARQARAIDPSRDAEPGKILHEERSGEMAALGEVPFGLYYGSIDSTPLFLMLAGAYHDRTGDLATIRELWPALDAALQWIDRYGDRDGDGFVEYASTQEKGLTNQGWKDSGDSIFHADGTLASSPIALCEVQGYVYQARLAAARLARALGMNGRAVQLRREARELRRRFVRAFWCPEEKTYALALDGNKRPCRVRTSNAGHCLTTGIALGSHARILVNSFLDPPFFNGWGIRTVARGEARYNPMSYHNGSVWPHDNSLIALGMSRYGQPRGAAAILSGLFEATTFFDQGRLPELWCGFARRAGEGPTLYPVACSPQAWAAGAPILLLQACLGLSFDVPRRRMVFNKPTLPEFLDLVQVTGIRTGDAVVDLEFRRHDGDVGLHVMKRSGEIEVVTRR